MSFHLWNLWHFRQENFPKMFWSYPYTCINRFKTLGAPFISFSSLILKDGTWGFIPELSYIQISVQRILVTSAYFLNKMTLDKWLWKYVSGTSKGSSRLERAPWGQNYFPKNKAMFAFPTLILSRIYSGVFQRLHAI